MPSFGDTSKERLFSCDPRLQKVFSEVVKHYDCFVLCGQRTKEEQDLAFAEGKSKLKYPMSKHNSIPSKAIDVAPYPIDWGDSARFHHFAGFVFGVAASMGIKLRWGGDWNKDFNFKNEGFRDLPHFELAED